MHPEESHDQSTAQSVPKDIDLYLDVRAGRTASLGILYDRYGRLVYGLAYRILNNAQEAEDLTQEIFLNFWHKGGYNPDRGSLSSYLIMMARSRSIDKIRARSTFRKFLDRWRKSMPTETYSNSPFEAASYNERSERVRVALGELSNNQRQILEMLYYEGLSQREIAERLDIPLGTVKTRSRLGLLKLRQTLEHLF
jgi:RNA polymerase sigma-70 factor (ECF subfamily)